METEAEMLARLVALEAKVDAIYAKLDQAMGAWLLIKIMGGVSIGFTVLYNFFVGHWK